MTNLVPTPPPLLPLMWFNQISTQRCQIQILFPLPKTPPPPPPLTPTDEWQMKPYFEIPVGRPLPLQPLLNPSPKYKMLADAKPLLPRSQH